MDEPDSREPYSSGCCCRHLPPNALASSNTENELEEKVVIPTTVHDLFFYIYNPGNCRAASPTGWHPWQTIYQPPFSIWKRARKREGLNKNPHPKWHLGSLPHLPWKPFCSPPVSSITSPFLLLFVDIRVIIPVVVLYIGRFAPINHSVYFGARPRRPTGDGAAGPLNNKVRWGRGRDGRRRCSIILMEDKFMMISCRLFFHIWWKRPAVNHQCRVSNQLYCSSVKQVERWWKTRRPDSFRRRPMNSI